MPLQAAKPGSGFSPSLDDGPESCFAEVLVHTNGRLIDRIRSAADHLKTFTFRSISVFL